MPIAACGPRSVLVFCHWLVSLCLHIASPFSCASECPQLAPYHCFHCDVCTHGESVQPEEENAHGQDLCICHCWSQPLPPALALIMCVYLEMACANTRSLHQAATAKYMHTAGHHYCLPWYLATGLGGATEDPTGVVALVDHLPCLPRTTEWMLWTLVT